MADKMYKTEQQFEKTLLDSIRGLIPYLCHISGCATEAVPVTRPNIDPASWVYELPQHGAKIIQKSEPVGHVSWREYEPDGKDRASIVLHYSATMNNGENYSRLNGGNQIWEFQVAISDPEKFWYSFQGNGAVEDRLEQYHNLLATLWSETFKIPIKHKKWQIKSLVTKVQTVGYPKADK